MRRRQTSDKETRSRNSGEIQYSRQLIEERGRGGDKRKERRIWGGRGVPLIGLWSRVSVVTSFQQLEWRRGAT